MPLTQPLAKPLSEHFSKPLSLLERNHTSIPARRRNANAWFGDHFGVAVPHGMREQADAMTWENFVTTYGTPPARCGCGTGRAPTPSDRGGSVRKPAISGR